MNARLTKGDVMFSKSYGRCIDWRWSENPRQAPGCRRERSCGAAHVDFCPLAPVRLDLTQRSKLESASGEAGVIRCGATTTFGRLTHDRVMKRLCALGLAEANAHGDHYITPAGREALKGQE